MTDSFPRLSQADPIQITNINSSQQIQQLRAQMNKFQQHLSKQFKTKQLGPIIYKACRIYSLGYEPPQNFLRLQSFLETQFPETPRQVVIGELFRYYQHNIQLSKEIDTMVLQIRNQVPKLDIKTAVSSLHNYFSVEGSIPYCANQRIALQQYRTQQRVNQETGYEFQQLNNDIFQPQQALTVKYFSGSSIQRKKKIIKAQQNFINQKKVVHVFSKKGYGLNHYKRYLEKRKLDTSEWQFYQVELIKNNRYNELLYSAIIFTVEAIFQYLDQSEGIFQIQPSQIQSIIPKLLEMNKLQNQTLRNCARVIYELKIQKEIQKEMVIQLHHQIMSFISLSQNRKLTLNNDFFNDL